MSRQSENNEKLNSNDYYKGVKMNDKLWVHYIKGPRNHRGGSVTNTKEELKRGQQLTYWSDWLDTSLLLSRTEGVARFVLALTFQSLEPVTFSPQRD